MCNHTSTPFVDWLAGELRKAKRRPHLNSYVHIIHIHFPEMPRPFGELIMRLRSLSFLCRFGKRNCGLKTTPQLLISHPARMSQCLQKSLAHCTFWVCPVPPHTPIQRYNSLNLDGMDDHSYFELHNPIKIHVLRSSKGMFYMLLVLFWISRPLLESSRPTIMVMEGCYGLQSIPVVERQLKSRLAD